MFEIQDAAKVITESMDPDAKVIFGTIEDEKLNKGEVKVTIIASGFPEGQRKALFGNDTEIKKETPAEETRGRIFNSLSPKKEEEPKKVEPKKVEAEKKNEENNMPEDDDEWSAVPAFLRRSKLK